MPPLEFISIELVYSLAVIILCLLIYFKTKDAYDLSKHKGIKYFRNAFMYFAVVFLFRILPIVLIFNQQLVTFGTYQIIVRTSLFLVSYFSILAILSLLSSMFSDKVGDDWESTLHLISLFFAVLTFFAGFQIILVLLGLIMLVLLMIKGFICHKEKRISFFSKMTLTYFFLFVFYIINLVSLAQYFFISPMKITLNILSLAIFVYIYYKVSKRLSGNGKKRQA